jgi:hypothetical protein
MPGVLGRDRCPVDARRRDLAHPRCCGGLCGQAGTPATASSCGPYSVPDTPESSTQGSRSPDREAGQLPGLPEMAWW